jgi:membrane associated rhomboid family serine protease
MFNVRERIASQWATAKKHLMLVLVVTGVLWVVFLADELIPDSWIVLNSFGIRSRTLGGFFCIPFAPFLHVNMDHLLANTPYMVLLGWTVALSGRPLFLRVFAFCALASGLGAWAFGKGDLPHEGVSGVLYGMIGFLLARGWFARRLRWALVALISGILYLGQLLLLLRNDPALSWASHFWGLVGGIVLAWWMYGRRVILLTPATTPENPRRQ